ncbi:MAG: radical SAM family heme chaperone HemW [Clostridia bacterium]|nr:radical SAM family heme chaperone HemW [Clostridia bacterium]
MKGLYIHIPFCRSKCPYCDFYSVPRNDALIEKYCDALIDEIETGRRTKDFTENSDMSFDTVYFGGGTPSVIGAERLGRILECIRKNYTISADAEITAECNPSTVDDEFFINLSSYGFNRISLGMQSAVDSERHSLGRLADKNKVLSVINSARKSGITNISLDVMLGVPSQTMESLDETVDFLLDTDVPHISAYMLSIEEGTNFHKRQDSLVLPDEDAVCDMYSHLAQRLTQQGFEHYEISNFAKSGFESRHNLKYWECEEYLGLGAAAHSFINGKRFFFERNAEAFISGDTAVFDSYGGDSEEFIMLALRLKKGISAQDYYKRFGCSLPLSFTEKAKAFITSGHMTLDGDTYSLTQKGMLISNYIISNLED